MAKISLVPVLARNRDERSPKLFNRNSLLPQIDVALILPPPRGAPPRRRLALVPGRLEPRSAADGDIIYLEKGT